MQVIAVTVCNDLFHFRKSNFTNYVFSLIMLNGFLYFIIFLFWSYFFLWRSLFFCLAMGVTLDQYRECIGLFNSFRVIKCSAYFWASFFSLLLMFIEISNAIYLYCLLKFIMLPILPFFNYFSFSSGNSVATEFHFFYMFYSYCIIM